MNDELTRWLEDCINQFETDLLRMCYAYLQEVPLAQDAVQETFLKAWKGYKSFHNQSNVKTWLTRIAINTCKDLRRSAWFRHVDRSVPFELIPEGTVPFTAKDDTLTRAVMALKPRLREVVLLYWYQELSGAEAAKALNISRSTLYKRLEKAQNQLRDELGAWKYEV